MSDDAKTARPGEHDEPQDEVEGHAKLGRPGAADEANDDEVEAHGRPEEKVDGKTA